MRKHISWATLVLLAVALGFLLTAGADAAVVTLQPGPTEGKDATVMGNSAKPEREDWNLGASTNMYVRADGSIRRHSFIEFDVSGISIAHEDIASVKLSLLDYYWANLGGYTEDREIGLYQVTSTWDEGSGMWGDVGVGNDVTYNNQPMVDYLTPLAKIMMPAQLTEAEALAGGTWHVWDSNDPGNSGLVDIVKGWAAGTIDNYGLVVRLTDPDDTTYKPAHYYWSSDYMDDPSLRPILEISDTGGSPDPIPGDANLDDVVNDADASILAANWQYGPDATWGQGDFTGDGIVNDADASILAAHWQESQEGAAPVPEPSSVVLLLCGIVSLLLLARRRR